MSKRKKARRNGQRETGRRQRVTPKGKGWTSYVPWFFAASFFGAAIVIAVFPRAGREAPHPVPTEEVSADGVVPAARYARYPRIAETYRQAAAVAPVLDGLYCYCHCSEHAGHRSLLDCFHSDHGAGCDVCLSEARIAFEMTQDGADLDEVRKKVDDLFG